MRRRSHKSNGPTLGGMVKKAGVKVLKGYLKGTQAIADKIAPTLNKLPSMPKRKRLRPRIQKKMK